MIKNKWQVKKPEGILSAMEQLSGGHRFSAKEIRNGKIETGRVGDASIANHTKSTEVN